MDNNIVIETSSDTVEEVKAALGQSVEIEEAQPEVKEEKPPAKPKEAKPAKTPEATEGEVDETATETETEEKEAIEEKPKKAVPKTVPLSRLNEEIAKRKALQRQLAEKDETPKEAAEAEEPPPPQNFSGKPEPLIDAFMQGVDAYDPVAVNKAIAGYTSAHALWSRAEARAEVAHEEQIKAQEVARLERTKLYRAALPDALKARPDYHDVVNDNKDVEMSQTMTNFMYDSEIGPFLLLHLIENPDALATVLAHPSERKQVRAMEELETAIAAELKGHHEEAGEAEPPKAKPLPPKKTISQAPPPPNRLKPAGPGPKTLQELAGPTERVGVDLDFNPEYERAVKARRGT